MICGRCNGPVEVKDIGYLPSQIGAPVEVNSTYLSALVCSSCQKKPKECQCPRYDWEKHHDR